MLKVDPKNSGKPENLPVLLFDPEDPEVAPQDPPHPAGLERIPGLVGAIHGAVEAIPVVSGRLPDGLPGGLSRRAILHDGMTILGADGRPDSGWNRQVMDIVKHEEGRFGDVMAFLDSMGEGVLRVSEIRMSGRRAGLRVAARDHSVEALSDAWAMLCEATDIGSLRIRQRGTVFSVLPFGVSRRPAIAHLLDSLPHRAERFVLGMPAMPGEAEDMAGADFFIGTRPPGFRHMLDPD